MISETARMEIWRSLMRGESLDRFRLPKKDGRTDLTGLLVPDPRIVDRWQTPIAEVVQTESREVNGVRWRNLDFSASTLRSLHLNRSEITNCRFDRCDLKDFNPGGTVFRDCSFCGTNLRGSGLGIATTRGPLSGKRNRFIGVDFSSADLRGTIYIAAAFERCRFVDAKISKLDFARSTFVDCRFEGVLREVQFWRVRPFPEEDVFPPNEMLNVDFSRAKLRWVEFRGLSLDSVHLPSDQDHIIIEDFASALDRLIAILKSEPDETSRVLLAILEVYRKWAPPVGRGVLNRRDLAEEGEELANRFLTLLRNVGARTGVNPTVN